MSQASGSGGSEGDIIGPLSRSISSYIITQINKIAPPKESS